MNTFAKTLGGVSILAILCGIVYTVDCRLNTLGNWDKAHSCYLTGFGFMGVGGMAAAGKKAYEIGYNTFNPDLHYRRPEEEEKRL